MQQRVPVGVAVHSAPGTAQIQKAGGAYTILAVTFNKKENALQEVQKLKALGFDAGMLQKGVYYLACVGSYADMSGAQSQRDLIKVKRIYADAFMRLR